MNDEVETLKKENAQLKAVIKELRSQLDAYKYQSRRSYYLEQDHVSYPDDDRGRE
jgi:cell division protein FtsB